MRGLAAHAAAAESRRWLTRLRPPPPGLPLADASAAKAPDGTLVATFTADLPQQPQEILSNPKGFNIIYSIGPLAPDGGLLPHPASNRPYGGTALRLPAAGAGGGAPAAKAPAAADPPAAAATSGPTGGLSSAPAPETERTATDRGCQFSLNGRQLSFSACTHLDGIGADTTLMWTLRPLGACQGWRGGCLRPCFCWHALARCRDAHSGRCLPFYQDAASWMPRAPESLQAMAPAS